MKKAKNGGKKTLFLGILIILAAGIWALSRLLGTAGSVIRGSVDAERVSFIESFGWEADKVPKKVKEVRIPAEFDEAYEQYNGLQLEQGFDLRPYRAHRATIYTYGIRNFEGGDPVVPICANIIVVDGNIVGADISSAEANGLVTVLAKKA